MNRRSTKIFHFTIFQPFKLTFGLTTYRASDDVFWSTVNEMYVTHTYYPPDFPSYKFRLFARSTSNIQNGILRLKRDLVEVLNENHMLHSPAVSLVLANRGYVHLSPTQGETTNTETEN